MKKLLTSLFAISFSSILLFSQLNTKTNAQELNTSCSRINHYEDVEINNVFCIYIEHLMYQDVVSESRTFFPNSDLNRGQLSKIIVNGFQIPIDTSGEQFPDVKEGHTFFNEIMTLKNSGVISGKTDGSFDPSGKVSRGALMKFITNSAQIKNGDLFKNNSGDINKTFSDLSNEHTFASYVDQVFTESENIANSSEKIIKGYSDNTFRVDNNVTRGEVSKSISNTMRYANIQNIACNDSYCQSDIKHDLEIRLENYLFELINSSRSNNGKPNLNINTQATGVARDWSNQMVSIGHLEHRTNLLNTLRDAGIGLSGAGENIGLHEVRYDAREDNYFSAVKDIHDLMMAEVAPNDGHRQNILGQSLNFDQIGIGIVIQETSGNSKVWMTEDYVVGN